MPPSRNTIAAVLLHLALLAVAHGDDEHMAMDMGNGKGAEAHEKKPLDDNDLYNLPSYAGLGMHGNMIMAHIVLMALAWFFVLPIGTSVRHFVRIGY